MIKLNGLMLLDVAPIVPRNVAQLAFILGTIALFGVLVITFVKCMKSIKKTPASAMVGSNDVIRIDENHPDSPEIEASIKERLQKNAEMVSEDTEVNNNDVQ